MWNNYWGGRPRRDIPRVNYQDPGSDSEEDNFASPRPPLPSRAGSPVELAVPQLNDNVDDELNQVSLVLKNVGHTPLFQKREVKEEEVVEGHVSGAPVGLKVN